MAVSLPLLRQLQSGSASDSWKAVLSYAWGICSQPLVPDSAQQEVTRRDSQIAELDLFLATAGWDLWRSYEDAVEHTADALANWWEKTSGGKAILILDALSLREAPWILQGAAERGYKVQARATGAELPADTTPFAKALGFSQRSALGNNGAGSAHRLSGARTDCVDYHWTECLNAVGADPQIVIWHQWPDSRVHDFAEIGKGLRTLSQEVAERLTDEEFWRFVGRLTTGRRLVITSDHGYAATGNFADTTEADQKTYLKNTYSSGRWVKADQETQPPWLPPIALTLETKHGRNSFVVGRRKWKSPAGYPTLAHGGLSVLEVASPFIEISRQ
jgi:hypothetical protein